LTTAATWANDADSTLLSQPSKESIACLTPRSPCPPNSRTLNCPSWCQTDHGQEWTTAVDLDAEAARLLAEYPEHYSKVLGPRGDQDRPVPPIWCPPIHRCASER